MWLKKKRTREVKLLKPVKPGRKRWLKVIGFIVLFSAACLLGAVFGAFIAVRRNLPPVSEIENFKRDIITVILSVDGQPVKEFARQKRVEIPYEKIPDILKKAIIATEDPRFFKHRGVDVWGILRAFKENVRPGRGSRRLEGGSTITQQLVRELFLYRHQTVGRKLKEMYLALQVEKRYPKEKILEMYCNQFYFGHGVYGVESASNLFFGKSVSDLGLEEAALIAGILRGPSRYSPYLNPDLTLRRRNHVLNRMEEEGIIPKSAAEDAKNSPLKVLPLQRSDSDFGAYFFEEVRKYIEKNYGYDALYREGLRVYTTFDPVLQQYAEDALIPWLRDMDKRLKGWRKDKDNLLKSGDEKLEDIWLEAWLSSVARVGETTDALVLSVTPAEAVVKVKNYLGRMANKGIEWTKSNNLEQLIKRGDVIQVKIERVVEETKELAVSLDQDPLIQGACVVLDNRTGQVKAMVGGNSFRKSRFNRATQAKRQAGSAIKPFLYTAGLESGQFTPASIIIDEPTTFIDKWTGEPWTPKNYDRKYKGAVTLRKGMEESRNVVTAKLLDAISPQTGVEYCRKFGIASMMYPYLSLSLGTFDVSLLELVSAYTTFPNKGIRVNPYFISRIEDKEGNVLEEAKIEAENVISPQMAYIMTFMLQGVVQRGTAAAASPLGKPLAGKTGTTDKYTDAWFIGFSPSLCMGVWVGHDTKVSIGDRQAGAVAALPVWTKFFGKVIQEENKLAKEQGKEPPVEEFEVPPNLSFVEIDRKTGLLLSPICLWPFREIFMPGTEPMRYCTHQDHLMILDYSGTEKAVEEHEGDVVKPAPQKKKRS